MQDTAWREIPCKQPTLTYMRTGLLIVSTVHTGVLSDHGVVKAPNNTLWSTD